MTQVSLFAAFGAGLLSFLSPCVLPIIPGYLSFISGKGIAEIKDGSARAGVLWRTAFFAAGFSTVFVVLGMAFSGGGMLLSGGASRWIQLASGAVIALFGVNMTFDLIRFLNRERRFQVPRKPAGAAGSFIVGMAFGAGWTPCIGPILASILLVASRSGSLARASLLLGLYSLGLAVPFLLAGAFFDRLTPLMTWFKLRGDRIRVVSGILLILLGMAMALGRLTAFNGILARTGMTLAAFASSYPFAARAVATAVWLSLAGLVVALAIIRKKKLLSWHRGGLAAAAALMAGLEIAGVLSTVSVLAGWLLFQGA